METTAQQDEYVAPEGMVNIDLPRFGECAFGESDVIAFPWGLPGFAQLRRFLILADSEVEGYVWLQSLDEVKVAIPLRDPWAIFGDYEAPLPLYATQSLGIERPESFCLLCVVVAAPGTGTTTMNLLAPIVINLERRIGRQITLESQNYSVRTPIPRQES